MSLKPQKKRSNWVLWAQSDCDCSVMSYIILGLVLFIAFSIGLNLGLHGVINVHNTGQVVSQGEPTRQQRANTDLRQGIKDVIVGKDKVPIQNVSPAKPHTP